MRTYPQPRPGGRPARSTRKDFGVPKTLKRPRGYLTPSSPVTIHMGNQSPFQSLPLILVFPVSSTHSNQFQSFQSPPVIFQSSPVIRSLQSVSHQHPITTCQSLQFLCSHVGSVQSFQSAAVLSVRSSHSSYCTFFGGVRYPSAQSQIRSKPRTFGKIKSRKNDNFA